MGGVDVSLSVDGWDVEPPAVSAGIELLEGVEFVDGVSELGASSALGKTQPDVNAAMPMLVALFRRPWRQVIGTPRQAIAVPVSIEPTWGAAPMCCG